MFSLILWDENKEEIFDFKIFIKKSEEDELEEYKIVNQIRHLPAKQFIDELDDSKNKVPIKEDSENTVIIKSSILDFIVDYDSDKKIEIEHIKKIEIEKIEKNYSFFKKMKLKFKKSWKNKSNISKTWFVLKTMAFVGCILVSTAIGILSTVMTAGAIHLIGIPVSIGLGFFAVPWNNWRNKIVDWAFGKKKSKIEDSEGFKNLKLENEKLKQQIRDNIRSTLNSSSEIQTMDMITNKFNRFMENNKEIPFDDLRKWLSNEINEENKNNYEKKKRNDMEKWEAFKESLKPVDSVINGGKELQSRYEKGKINEEEFKQYGQRMWEAFNKSGINGEWKYNWMPDCEMESRTNIVTDNPFNNLNRDQNLDNQQPSTSTRSSSL